MKKRLLLSLIFAVSSVAGYAYTPHPSDNPAWQSSMKNMKFGLQFGRNLFSSKYGAYFEYQLLEGLGLQSGLFYFSNDYILNLTEEATHIKFAFVKPKYISLPMILRSYPGAGRQFCFFAGLQTGYLIAGRQLLVNYQLRLVEDFEAILNLENIRNQNSEYALKEIAEVNKFDFDLLIGFDYEFSFGLTLGLSYTKGFIDIIKGKESYGNWTLQPVIGYNIAKLIQHFANLTPLFRTSLILD
jgi:hypothetical protein